VSELLEVILGILVPVVGLTMYLIGYKLGFNTGYMSQINERMRRRSKW